MIDADFFCKTKSLCCLGIELGVASTQDKGLQTSKL